MGHCQGVHRCGWVLWRSQHVGKMLGTGDDPVKAAASMGGVGCSLLCNGYGRCGQGGGRMGGNHHGGSGGGSG